MNRLIVILLGTSLVALAGCTANMATVSRVSEVPIPVAYIRSNQLKMQAARHWDVLAKYQAERILEATNYLSKPFYIQPHTATESPFAHAYRTMLQTHLVAKGATVTTSPVAGGLQISYQTQILEHTDRGYTEVNSWKEGSVGARPVVLSNRSFWDYEGSGNDYKRGNPGWGWTWRGTSYDDGPHEDSIGYDSSRHHSKSYDQGGLGRQTFGWGHSNIDPTEVIITTQILDGRLVLYSTTNVFYYNPGDTDHYRYVREGRTITFGVIDQPSGASAGEWQQPEGDSSWQ